jgi:hypothetical protein
MRLSRIGNVLFVARDSKPCLQVTIPTAVHIMILVSRRLNHAANPAL